MHRREFINIWIRYLLLALLGVVSIFALIKSKDSEAAACAPGNLCASCNKIKGCTLPQKVQGNSDG